MNRKHSGMTMIGFLITLAVIILFIYCGMKIIPMYSEFYSVKQALAGMASEPELGNASKDKIRTLFNRRMDMSYALTVLKMDPLKIESTDTGYMLTVEYERRESLIANLDIVGKFHAEQALVRGAGVSN
ncbi:DUF4845 domain-containing protein [Thermomonas sp.]|uniref:DUF4845 domain-containing protein n=1 Tax=Thermomonas sp. TaxID=1971895 RepID=UPI002487C99D|nr:DUF4845 domain-containing protein [Thermomonas sp.]MDI1253770.1 DUF4845 domain-containing protein [Thermomonas sp.]